MTTQDDSKSQVTSNQDQDEMDTKIVPPSETISKDTPDKKDPDKKYSYRATFTFHLDKPGPSWSDSTIPLNNVRM